MKLLPITSSITLDRCLNPPLFNGITIFICSYPKSGTTWTQSIVYHILNTHLNTMYSADTANNNIDIDSITHISDISPFYEADSTWDLSSGLIKEKYTNNHIKFGNIRIFNTHLLLHMLPKGNNYKHIYCYREGKDVVTSFYYHLSNQIGDGGTGDENRTTSFSTFLSLWLNGDIPYGKHTDHLLSYITSTTATTTATATTNTGTNTTNASIQYTANNSNILYLCYEDMVGDLLGQVKRVVAFLGLDSSISDSVIVESILPRLSFRAMKADIDR